jgi:autophagy-related protein 33
LASRTLSTIQTQASRQILTLASISSLALITAFTLASPKGRHPYLLWTALVSFIGGQGVEYWFNGFSRFPSWRLSRKSRKNVQATKQARTSSPAASDESGYIEVDSDGSEDQQVNGEKVEMEMTRERKIQKVRSWIAGIGFAMGVVGIWGDGA